MLQLDNKVAKSGTLFSKKIHSSAHTKSCCFWINYFIWIENGLIICTTARLALNASVKGLLPPLPNLHASVKMGHPKVALKHIQIHIPYTHTQRIWPDRQTTETDERKRFPKPQCLNPAANSLVPQITCIEVAVSL